jgi:hypothetical protein
MSRGREENHALVVCEELDLEHGRDRLATPVEVLGAVMRRNDLDRSAHEVMRAELSRSENRAFLADLVAEANKFVDQQAGPDHSAELAERLAAQERLTRRLADLRQKWAEMEQATRDDKRHLAEVKRWAALPERERVRESPQIPSVRLQRAEEAVRFSERNERVFTNLIERATHDVYELSRDGGSLDQLRDTQARREQWIAKHPKEVEWARALEERLALREREAELLRQPRDDERCKSAEQTYSRYPTHGVAAEVRDRGPAMEGEGLSEEEVPEEEPEVRSAVPEWEPYHPEPDSGLSWEERMVELDQPDLGPGGPVIGM